MKAKGFWAVGAALVAASLWLIFDLPYFALSFPPVADPGYWRFFDAANMAIFLFLAACLAWFWQIFLQKKALSRKGLFTPSLIVVAIYSLLIIWFGLSLYRLWSGHPLTRYFLPPQSTYYWQMIWRFAANYLWAAVSGLFFAGVFFIIELVWILPFRRLSLLHRRRMAGVEEFGLTLFIGMALGPLHTLVAANLAVVVAVIELLVAGGGRKSIRLAAPLALGALLSLFFGRWLIDLGLGYWGPLDFASMI